MIDAASEVASPTSRSAEALRLEGITKSFAENQALIEVDFSLARGEIHGLVGENGAGKSTLVKIITGAYSRDAGDYWIDGAPQGDLSPHEAAELGISVIHQDRQLVPHFSVAESLFLGRKEPQRGGLLARRKMNRLASEIIHDLLGATISGSAIIGSLSVGQQQLVQIARGLADEPKVLVLDEPTAPLGGGDINVLFGILEELRAGGIGVVYISHHLRELSQLCDRVTVLRNGRSIDSLAVGGADFEQRLVRLMVGREIEQRPQSKTPRTPRRPLLSVEGLKVPGRLEGVDFELGAGEVLGVTGLVGSGTRELARAVYGIQATSGGRIRRFGADGAEVGGGSHDTAFVPEDRRGEGLVLDMSVEENISLASLEKHSKATLVRHSAERATAAEMIERLDIRPPKAAEISRLLSGGNQQKTVLGRWLAADPSLFVLEQPTAGVDIGAREDIHRIIDELVDDGAAVLLITYDLDELIRLADRILILYRGRVAMQMAGDQTTADTVLAYSTGSLDEASPRVAQ